MPDNLSPEAQRLLAARQAAVEELRAIDGEDRSITDHDVVRVSNARLLVDALMLRSLSGDAVGLSEFRIANELVDSALKAAGKRAPAVRLSFVEGVTGMCPKCGARIEDWVSPPKPSYPSTIDVKANELVEASKSLPAPKASPRATPSPASATPESKPVNPSMDAFERRRGYGTAPDGGPGRGDGRANGAALWWSGGAHSQASSFHCTPSS
jgi:hypothetical protein